MADKPARVSAVSQFKGMSPSDAGLMRRLIKDDKKPRNRGDAPADIGSVATILRRNIRNGTDYENILRVLPALKLPISILVSSIMSPGDLVKQELNIRSKMNGADNTLLTRLDKSIVQHFINEMQMQTQISGWLEDALVLRGSHPILIIPEASLDKMMKTGNYSEEGYSSLGVMQDGWYSPKGILGVKQSDKELLSMESAFTTGLTDNLIKHTIQIPKAYVKPKVSQLMPVRITDNPAVLRQPAVNALRAQKVTRNAYGVPAFEAAIKKKTEGRQSPEEVYSNYFKSSSSKTKRLIVMPSSKSEEAEGLGHPLVYHLPPECVAPCFIPGNPEDPTGYFVALDNSGYPASYLSRLDFYSDIRSSWAENAGGNQQAGSILNMAKDVSSGAVADYSDHDIDRMVRTNADILERELISRIASGAKGEEVKIGMTDGFNKMMLARWCSNQYTTLLYVPAEYMVYLAFDYTPFGVGKSLLEDLKEQAAQTAAIKVANTLQALKNAIPGKDLNIKLDPDDANPEETIVESVREALTLMFYHLPTNVASTSDIATQIQQSSMNINIEGNEYYPDMKSSITDRERVNASPDTELYQKYVDELYSGLGVPPELMSGVNQPDFAVTAVQQSVMLRKRVVAAQTLANPAFTDFVRIYTTHSGPLCSELIDIINSNKKMLPKEYADDIGGFLIEYINSLFATLPEPIIDDMEHKSDLIDKFITALDKILPAWVAATYFAGYDPEEYKTQIEEVQQAIRGVIIRSWVRKHGIMPELDIFSTDEEGKLSFSTIDEVVNHNDAVAKSMGHYIERMTTSAKERGKEVKKALKADASGKQAVEDLESPPEVDEGIVATDTPESGDDLGQPEETSDDATMDLDNQDDLGIDDTAKTDGGDEGTPPDEPEV